MFYHQMYLARKKTINERVNALDIDSRIKECAISTLNDIFSKQIHPRHILGMADAYESYLINFHNQQKHAK